MSPFYNYATLQRRVTHMQWSDNELLTQVMAGDAEAFTRIDEKQRPRVVGFRIRHVGNVADAKDLAQLTMFRVWQEERCSKVVFDGRVEKGGVNREETVLITTSPEGTLFITA
ncbi:MAG: hypothetical protein WKF77_31700 [Planctomycetaceae bacterium]